MVQSVSLREIEIESNVKLDQVLKFCYLDNTKVPFTHTLRCAALFFHVGCN